MASKIIKCPNCDLSDLDAKAAIGFMLTWPSEILHCKICGACYIMYQGKIQRYEAAEGAAEE